MAYSLCLMWLFPNTFIPDKYIVITATIKSINTDHFFVYSSNGGLAFRILIFKKTAAKTLRNSVVKIIIVQNGSYSPYPCFEMPL